MWYTQTTVRHPIDSTHCAACMLSKTARATVKIDYRQTTPAMSSRAQESCIYTVTLSHRERRLSRTARSKRLAAAAGSRDSLHTDFPRQGRAICREHSGSLFRFDTPDLGKIRRISRLSRSPLPPRCRLLLVRSSTRHQGRRMRETRVPTRARLSV